MDWATARSVLLVAAANSILAGRNVGAFWPVANVFHFTRAVRFAGDAETDADNPNAWFEMLRRKRARGLLLGPAIATDRLPWKTVAPIEDQLRMKLPIVEVFDSDDDCWRTGDDRFHKGEEKGWSTLYKAIPSGERPLRPDMDRVATDLEIVVTALASFSRHNGLEKFAASFEAAIACLHGAGPSRDSWYIAECEQLLPDLRARKLFGASASAHVFGAMGAWNDRNSDDETPEYLSLTLQLIAASNAASQAVANSTFDWP